MQRLQFIKDGFEARDIQVKPIILIREPVSRIKSAVRFNLDRKNYNEGILAGETDFLTALRQYYPSEDCRIRTSYHTSITNAFNVFGRDNVFVGIYEKMFEAAEIEKLSAYCGVGARPEFAKVYPNKTKSAVGHDTALEAEIREAYNDVYEFCFDAFPATKDLWAQKG